MSKRYKRYDDIYVVGSNAVKVERYYEIPKQKPRTHTKRKVKRTTKKENIVKSNPIYTFVLVSAIMATLVSCIVLMKAQFTVAESSAISRNLQNELNELRRINSELEASNKEAVNLDEIYKVATKELGMVLPEKKDVYYVDVQPVTYTKQFSEIEIPEEEGASVGNVLGIISKGW